MKCLLLSSPFSPCTILNSRCISFRRTFMFHALGSGFNNKGWIKSGCCASGKFSEDLPKEKHNGFFRGIDGSNLSFGTVDAEITLETVDFFVSDAEGDPDRPSEGYLSIDEAINTLKQGKFVITVDDENGEQEGNLIMSAALVNTRAIAFMIKHGSGIVSVGMKEEDLERLMIPLMSPITEVDSLAAVASTVTVDARIGTSTGVSAADRARTIVALSSIVSKPGDFRRPGHVFPLKYRNGGVLKRAAHTEASVDLVILAGLRPASVLSTIVDPNDGSMARLPFLKKFAKEFDIPIISITDLIRSWRRRVIH